MKISSPLDYYYMSLGIEKYQEFKIVLGSSKYYLSLTAIACSKKNKD